MIFTKRLAFLCHDKKCYYGTTPYRLTRDWDLKSPIVHVKCPGCRTRGVADLSLLATKKQMLTKGHESFFVPEVDWDQVLSTTPLPEGTEVKPFLVAGMGSQTP